MSGRGERPAPQETSERQIRRLELLALVNLGIVLAALGSFVLSLLPLTLSLFRLAVLILLLVCAGAGLWLRRRFWAVLDRELRRRKEAEQEARSADRAKGELLSHVSHEIRTPINGVLGMAELLLSGELTPVQREQMEVIGKSAGSLLTLVNDVLDLSRIEARQMLLRPRDYSFRKMVGDVLRLLAPRAAEREVELRLHVNPAMPDDLHGDPERLRQVFLNLVGNGIRFTRKGSVTVTVEPLERIVPVIRCEVCDTGVGIRPEVQERLFQPFVQGQSFASHGFGGTGLGLVIAKNIIEVMGGEIGFHSTRGVGSTFWFRVPLTPARGSAGQTPAPDSDAEARRMARHDRRILVVDDRSANRSVAVALLQKLGYSAEAVESGEAALAFLAKRPCAAVLLDVEMPGLGGFETCRRLRRQEADGGRTPVIALTAHTSAEEREKCFAAGMDAFLPKPFHLVELAAALDRWTGIETAPAEPATSPPRSPSPLSHPTPGRGGSLPAGAGEGREEAPLSRLEEWEMGEGSGMRSGGGTLAGEGLAERLASLKALEGETGGVVLAAVVEAFLQQGEKDLAAMQRALPQGDGEALAAAAHALAGSSGILGAADLARSAVELSRLASQGELDVCRLRLAEVEQEYRTVARKLAL